MITRRTLLRTALLAPAAPVLAERQAAMSPALGAPYSGPTDMHFPRGFTWEGQPLRWRVYAEGLFVCEVDPFPHKLEVTA